MLGVNVCDHCGVAAHPDVAGPTLPAVAQLLHLRLQGAGDKAALRLFVQDVFRFAIGIGRGRGLSSSCC